MVRMSTGLSYPSQLRFAEKCFNVSTNTAVKTCMVMGRQCFGPLIGGKALSRNYCKFNAGFGTPGVR
jgi:hypothetical protein